MVQPAPARLSLPQHKWVRLLILTNSHSCRGFWITLSPASLHLQGLTWLMHEPVTALKKAVSPRNFSHDDLEDQVAIASVLTLAWRVMESNKSDSPMLPDLLW